MADAKDKKTAPKAAAKEAKAPKTTETKAAKPKAAKPAAAAAATAAAPAGPACTVEKCKQPARAKGLCRKHFMGWRRGVVGKKHRYKICTKEGCRKPRVLGSRCAEHSAKGEAAAAAAPAA